MRTRLNKTPVWTLRILFAVAFAAVVLFAASRSQANCGPMDVVLVIDDTGSMGGAIGNVQGALAQIIAAAQVASGGDLRMGLVTFPSDNVVVNVPFTSNTALIQGAVNGLVAAGGNNEPESSDEALQYVITGAADASCSVSNGPLGSFRPGSIKIAVLITDAHPGECNDVFVPGVSDAHAHLVALDAANAGILISAIYVPTSGELADVKAIMQDYATTSGGEFVETLSNGSGTGEAVTDIIASCGGSSHACITRNARFWFTHALATGSSTNCVTLLEALRLGGGQLDLGFISLPTTIYTSVNTADGVNALIEALGLYYKGTGRTGENDGTQNAALAGSKLCAQRKLLSIELIAATANYRLLGTSPQNCTYKVNGVTTNFPSDLLAQARAAAAGESPANCATMTLLLRKFNQGGVAQNFPNGLVECSPTNNATLKRIGRDPTTQVSCPGLNNSCITAEAIAFPTNDPFASPRFSDSIALVKSYVNNPILNLTTVFVTNLLPTTITISTGTSTVTVVTNVVTITATITTNMTGIVPVPSCSGLGAASSNGTAVVIAGAMWKITPDVGVFGRHFTVDTKGGNIRTVLAVFSGVCSNLTEVTCASQNIPLLLQSQVSFTTDGINTFYIVGESADGSSGRLNLHVSSP